MCENRDYAIFEHVSKRVTEKTKTEARKEYNQEPGKYPEENEVHNELKDFLPDDEIQHKLTADKRVEVEKDVWITITAGKTESEKKAEEILNKERDKYKEKHGHYLEGDGIVISVYL